MEKEKTLKIITIVLGAVAALLIGALAYNWITKNNSVKDLNVEKAELTSQMMDLRNEYDSLTVHSNQLTDSLAVEKEKVDQLIERFQKTEATNRAQIKKYEKELGTLRSIMKHYIVQIDSLNSLNMSLKQEASEARRAAAESKRKYDDLVSTTEQYAATVEKGSVVKGRGITLLAINNSNKETDRSSRVAKLRTDITLVENTIAKKGYKRVYIRVKGPDGILIAEGEQTTFSCAGEEMIASASREVDYQGEEVEISIWLSSSQGFTKGVYTVDVYTTETKLGSADLLLR